MFKELSDLYIENKNTKKDSIDGDYKISDELNQVTTNAVNHTIFSVMEGSMYFLYGCYHSYCRLNDIKEISDIEFVGVLEEIKGKKDLEEYLKENIDVNVYKFFHWYLFEREEK